MSILISDKELLELIQELAEEKKQSPEQVVAEAVVAYATKRPADGDAFWESIIGLGSSGDPTLAERDEETLSEDIDPIRGWGSPRGDTNSD